MGSETRSGQAASYLAYPTKGIYGSLGAMAIEEENKAMKELVNWNSLSLCCSMQVKHVVLMSFCDLLRFRYMAIFS